MKKFTMSISIFLVAAFTALTHAEWGTVKGRFTYDGTPPKQTSFQNVKDPVCIKAGVTMEELVVNPENKGIANVAVYLYLKRGAKVPKIHPSYDKTAKDKVVLDNKNCRFVPHVFALRTTQTLLIKNSDPTSHNAAINTFARGNPARNNVIPAGQQSEETFKNAESAPTTISCGVHAFMTARMILKDHPYVVISDKDGNFELKNLPVGKHSLQFWHEKCGYVREAKQGGKTVKIKRGRLELTVKKGDNDLGEYALKSVFKGK